MRFTGRLTCGLCGCAITAEVKKRRYVYYHCTGYRGRCGNTYIREEDLAEVLGEIVSRVQISPETAALIAQAPHESQMEKEQHHRESVQRLARRRDNLQSNLD